MSPPARPDHPPRTPLAEVAEVVRLLSATPVAGEAGDPTRRTDGRTDGRTQGRTGGLAGVITGVALGSARVRAGDLYAALPGARVHGADFARDAVERGAVAVLTDEAGAARCTGLEVPVLVVPDPRSVLGALAARVYGDPAERLRLMAVTGTQGKTTTTRLLESALAATGLRTAVIGTVGTRMAGRELPSSLTTPEAPDLHALFAAMVEQGVDGCAMEVSSHALVMGRVDGVVFDVAAFSNLGRDHLDFHADMEDYYAAKVSLFTPAHCRAGLANLDDEYGRRLLDVAEVPMRTFSAQGAAEADWRAVDVVLGPTGSEFTVVTPAGDRHRSGVPLVGDFNVANALCAIALAGEAGFDVGPLAAAMAHTLGVPGRLERIDLEQDFLALVDYSHKPDALRAALSTLRPLTPGRLILVVGAGGDRDPGKRPMMGEVGAQLADVLIVTDDNPRTEDPAQIRAAMLRGTEVPGPERAEVIEIAGRGEAIRAAVTLACTGDTVLIAGKGHETGQEVAGVVHPFDDRDEVRAALRARRDSGGPP